MKRRAVLGAAAGACSTLVAGCTGRDDATAANETTTAETGTSDTTTTAGWGTYPTPTAEDFAFEARVVDGSPDGGPPRVGVELTNVADHAVRFDGGLNMPFSEYVSTGSELALIPDDRDHLFPSDGNTLVPGSRGECWMLAAGVAWQDLGRTARLGPDERMSEAFSVYATDSGSCPGAGSYRFESDTSDVTLSLTVERTEDGHITDALGSV
jgi:hypothetical protein